MLQRIRDRISGWIAGVIIALVGGAFILFGVEYYFEEGRVAQESVAEVNGVSITHEQYQHLVTQLQKRTEAQLGGKALPPSMMQELKSYALQSIITQTALFTTLQKEGFRIATTQVEALIEQTPEFQEQGHFSEAKMLSMLYQVNLTPEAFFQRVRTDWIISQVTSGVALSGFALPDDIQNWYELAHQSRAFGYFIIPMQSMLSSVTITENDIKNEYTANQKEYQTPAKVSVSYVILSPSALAKSISITEADAKAYYESHASNYHIPQRWVVSQITLPVSDEKQMPTVAKAFAENKKTGYASTTVTLSAAQIDPTLQSVLSQLKVGEVSKPLRTPNGDTILKLMKVMPAETKSFESVKQNLIALMQHQAINQALTKKSSELVNLTYTNPDTLEPAAKALDLTIQTSPMISKSGEKTGLFSNPAVLNAIFSHSVFDSENNSSPIDLGNGEQMVLRINKKEPSQPIPLSTVSQAIKTKLAQKQAETKAGILAYQIEKQIASGISPETIAKENNLIWHVVPLTEMDAKSAVAPAAILSEAFKTVGTKAVLMNQHDYAVIQITQVKNADVTKASSDEKQKAAAQLSALWGQVAQRCFVSSVIADSKVKVDSKKV